MPWLLIFIAVMIGILYYVFNIRFEWGTGFSEMKKYFRDAEYEMLPPKKNKEAASDIELLEEGDSK